MSHDDVDGEGREEGTLSRGRHHADHAAQAADRTSAADDVGGGDNPERDSHDPDSEQVKNEIEAVEEILEAEIDDRLDGNRRATGLQFAAEWKAPIPHPDALARYEEICPGAANRVLAMAERNLAIREVREATVRAAIDGEARVQGVLAEADRDSLKRGQYLAAAISALVAALSFAGMFLTPWAAIGFAVPLAQVASSLVRTVSDGDRSRRSNSAASEDSGEE